MPATGMLEMGPKSHSPCGARRGNCVWYCCAGDSRPWIHVMIKKLKSGQYRLYSRKRNPGTGKRRNLGTFRTKGAAKRHESEVQFFKRRG